MDYTPYFSDMKKSTNQTSSPTIHGELVTSLVILVQQILPIQDLVQLNRVFKNCWFFLEIAMKSFCLYTVQFKQFHKNSNVSPKFEPEFYNSISAFNELLVDSILKYGAASKDAEFVNSYKSCNRSLAMFVKVKWI